MAYLHIWKEIKDIVTFYFLFDIICIVSDGELFKLFTRFLSPLGDFSV